MVKLLADIESSWANHPLTWDKHRKQLMRFLKAYSDAELIGAAQFLEDRNLALYRTDVWIGAHLMTEGFMSCDAFNYLTDCICSTPDSIYQPLNKSGDAFIDYPQFNGYDEQYFTKMPQDVYDRRKGAPESSFLMIDQLKRDERDPWDNIKPFNRAVAQRLTPRLYDKFKDEVAWKENGKNET